MHPRGLKVVQWERPHGAGSLGSVPYTTCFCHQLPPVCVFKQTDKQTRVLVCCLSHLDQSGCISGWTISADRLISLPWTNHLIPPIPPNYFWVLFMMMLTTSITIEKDFRLHKNFFVCLRPCNKLAAITGFKSRKTGTSCNRKHWNALKIRTCKCFVRNILFIGWFCIFFWSLRWGQQFQEGKTARFSKT